MKRKSLFLLMSAILIVSADLAYLYGRGGGGGGGGHAGGFGGGHGGGFGGGRGFSGGGRGFSGGGRSFSGGGARTGGARSAAASRASSSRPAAGTRAGTRTGTRAGTRSGRGVAGARGFGHHGYYGHGWNRGGFGYWGAGWGGWGWGLWGFGFYLPLELALLYGISNQGGEGDTTVINNYNTIPVEDGQNTGTDNAPQVPQDAVFISPEMMNDPKVKQAMREAQIKQAQEFIKQEQSEDTGYSSSTSRALQKGRAAMAA